MIWNPFVIPFSLGVIFMMVALLTRFYLWSRKLTPEHSQLIRKNVFTRKTLHAIREVFRESLLHKRMFRVHGLLGYMHMTFAFGWFLLIIIGNIETRIHSGSEINPPYYPIFFKYWLVDKSTMPFNQLFTYLMDLLLLFVLSALVLALIKRTHSRMLGLKRTTNINKGDRIALFALWAIFPFRLISESLSSSVNHQGGFLTDNVGRVLAEFLPAEQLILPAWWAYSIVLGVFFVSLPFTRYLHIPAEVVLIFIRHYELKPSKKFDHFSQMELFSCPRCGVCIDKCQLASVIDQENIPPGHFFHSIRDHRNDEQQAFNCLLCGRCEEICPVKINTLDIRVQRRVEYQPASPENPYNYLFSGKTQHAEILYFAGCMTHLNPGIKKAMVDILNASGLSWFFMDEQGGACCGRPLKMAGRYSEAQALVDHNQLIINTSKPVIMVTSCPICLKTFKEDYQVDAKLMHHSEFIHLLIEKEKIKVEHTGMLLSYHDPCELGRGLSIYNPPRQVLHQLGNLQPLEQEAAFSLCCGGSLGNTCLSSRQKDALKDHALGVLLENNPDTLVTACPLCKKTLGNQTVCNTLDIAEITVMAMQKQAVKPLVEHNVLTH